MQQCDFRAQSWNELSAIGGGGTIRGSGEEKEC